MNNANGYSIVIGKHDGCYGRKPVATVMDGSIVFSVQLKETIQ